MRSTSASWRSCTRACCRGEPLPADTLELPARRDLYQAIRGRPGVYQRELQRLTGLATGALDHHLRVLEDEGLVNTRTEANRLRYFASDVPRQDKDILKLLRPRPTRHILLALLEEPGLSLSDVATRVGLAVSTTHTHVKRLIDNGLVEKRREGSAVALEVAEPDACVKALVTYRPTLLDRAVDRFLEAFGALDPGAVTGRE